MEKLYAGSTKLDNGNSVSVFELSNGAVCIHAVNFHETEKGTCQQVIFSEEAIFAIADLLKGYALNKINQTKQQIEGKQE